MAPVMPVNSAARSAVILLTTAAILCPVTVLCGSTSDQVLNVHLVSHSHDDVGWLKTVDQYYYGSLKHIQHAAVQFILDTATAELMKNPQRKFIYVEMAFFTRWWREQTPEYQEKVKQLVENGQLEFINAGWSMNDEACTDYNAIIDQMSLGLRFVEQTFGASARPRVAWHIDPFGHSAEQASLFAMMGFDGFFFGRIDYDDKIHRLDDKAMEMVWSGSRSLGSAADIFSGVTYNLYQPPKGFCFDIFCTDTEIRDDPRLEDYNVDSRVDDFLKVCQEQAKYYKTKNIMLTMGSDFQYEDASEWFTNLDKLIAAVNKNGSVHVFYSTPSIYLDALHAAGETWPVKSDDFFPYADHPHAFWTGYFTSRPALKRYIRLSNSHLQACKQLEAVTKGPATDGAPTSMSLQEAMGIAQHHDAITGTSKQNVADDYAKRLHIGQVECGNVMSSALNNLAVKPGSPSLQFQFCEYLNVSICSASETNSFNLIVYNPLARNWTGVLRMPVNEPSLQVVGVDGKEVTSQIVPVSNATDSVRRDRGNASYDLLIQVDEQHAVPNIGYTSFFVRPATNFGSFKSHVYTPKLGEDVTISNDLIELVFDGFNNRLKHVSNLASKVSLDVNQGYFWYVSNTGDIVSSQASGAYIFRTYGKDPLSANPFPQLTVIDGPVVKEVHQEFTPWLYQVVRLLPGKNYAEFEYTIGPIPSADRVGKEVITRFTTDLKTNATWYTDANGREMKKRVRDYRATWDWNDTGPISGNYYPVNSRIFIRDEDSQIQLTVLNDRSQGGSSLADGALELMVHRRLFHDDNRGVGEALNELGQFGDGLIIRGKHYLLLDTINKSSTAHRLLGEQLMLEPQLAFLPSTGNITNFTAENTVIHSGIMKELPANVHLLTLEYLGSNTLLLRLEHQFAVGEALSQPANVSLAGLFSSFTVKDVTELTLGGNAPLSDVTRLQWNTGKDSGRPFSALFKPVKAPLFYVELKPMEIRTFSVLIQ